MEELKLLGLATAELSCKNHGEIKKLERKFRKNKVGTQLAMVGIAWAIVIQAAEIQKLKDTIEKRWKE